MSAVVGRAARSGADADTAGSEMKMRCTGTCMKSPPNSVCTRRAVRAELARDLHPVGGAELAAHGVRHEVQRRLVHRTAVNAVKAPALGMAVGLQPALEQDDHARLAARRRPQQQQKPPANLGAGARGRNNPALSRVSLMPKQLVGEELAFVRIMSQMYWWLERAMPRASVGNTLSRNWAKVPAQFAARCCLVNLLNERMRLERFRRARSPFCIGMFISLPPL